MPFAVGDSVHIAGLGKGTVREVRNADRYLVEVNGRALVVTGNQLTRHDAPIRKRRPEKNSPQRRRERGDGTTVSLDLHGKTVDEAIEAAISFLDRALRDGDAEVHFIHGRGGGRIKAALHAALKNLPSVRRFRLDPKNAGVTIVDL
jgi:dsDNA-specific endonuclease/ATPase MutS2